MESLINNLKNIAFIVLVLVLSGCSYSKIRAAKEIILPSASKHKIAIDNETLTYYQLGSLKKYPKRPLIFFFTGTGCHSANYELGPRFSAIFRDVNMIALQQVGVKHLSTGKNALMSMLLIMFSIKESKGLNH